MATALTSIVTMVGYELGMTISTDTTPTITEVTQWIRDAQRAMLVDLKADYLGGRLKTEEASLAASTYDNISGTDDTILELETATYYDAAPTPTYTACRVVEYPAFASITKRAKNTSLISSIASLNPSDGKVYVYPAGVAGDELHVSYRQDIDQTDSNYELNEVTIPVAVQYACYIASLQSEDMVSMAQKFLEGYNRLIQPYMRRGK